MPTSIPPTKSTIVRPQNWRVTAMRAAFTVLDRVAPNLAGWWALRIWCTLPTSAARHQDNRPYPGRQSTVTLDDGRLVAVETWEPDVHPGATATTSASPDGNGQDVSTPVSVPMSTDEGSGIDKARRTGSSTVYLVHGWGGWRGQLAAFAAPLLEAGQRVVAFDVPSHGRSSPSRIGRGRATAVDFVDALRAVVVAHGEPAGLVVHSLGCSTTTLALRDGMRARRLVFVAPGPDPLGTTDQLQRVLGYGPRTRRHFFIRLSRLAGRPLEDFNAFTVDAADNVPPALVIHDRDDKQSPYDDGAQLAATWPEAELVTTEGLGHQRILTDDTVIKLTVDFLASR